MAYLTTDQDTPTLHPNHQMHQPPFHASPSTPQKILHISCGTGLLTHHLAKTFPSAQIIGISPKPVDASRHGRLPNLMYIKASLEELVAREDMLFWPGTFDYIFQRGGARDVEGWDEHVKMVVGLLGEGGWVEMQEESGLGVFAGRGREGVLEGGCLSEGWEWVREVERGGRGKGVDFRCGEKLGGWFRGAGLVGVEDVVYKVPLVVDVSNDAGEETGRGTAGLQQTIKANQDLVEKYCSKNHTAEAISRLKESVSDSIGKCVEGDFTEMHVATGRKPSS